LGSPRSSSSSDSEDVFVGASDDQTPRTRPSTSGSGDVKPEVLTVTTTLLRLFPDLASRCQAPGWKLAVLPPGAHVPTESRAVSTGPGEEEETGGDKHAVASEALIEAQVQALELNKLTVSGGIAPSRELEPPESGVGAAARMAEGPEPAMAPEATCAVSTGSPEAAGASEMEVRRRRETQCRADAAVYGTLRDPRAVSTGGPEVFGDLREASRAAQGPPRGGGPTMTPGPIGPSAPGPCWRIYIPGGSEASFFEFPRGPVVSSKRPKPPKPPKPPKTPRPPT